jgi:hypothetical protein
MREALRPQVHRKFKKRRNEASEFGDYAIEVTET